MAARFLVILGLQCLLELAYSLRNVPNFATALRKVSSRNVKSESALIDYEGLLSASLSVVTGGISQEEHNALEQCVAQARGNVDMQKNMGLSFYLGDESVSHPDVPVGPLGRVCVVAGFPDEDADELRWAVSEMIDSSYESGLLSAPVATYFVSEGQMPLDLGKGWSKHHLEMSLSAYFDEYSLAEEMKPLASLGGAIDINKIPESLSSKGVPPSFLVHIDGAHMEDRAGSRWDVSSVAVFDGLVTDVLRNELLALLVRPGGGWDPNEGPDPEVWEKNGLLDVPLIITGNGIANPSCGLRPEAIEFLCASPPESGAIAAFEDILRRSIFPNYRVTRMPESVFGEGVS